MSGDIALVATNMHRVFLLKASLNNMAANVDSTIIDIKDMSILFLQALWTGLAGGSGTLEVQVSAFDDAATMSLYPGSLKTIPGAHGLSAESWNISKAGFRYARIVYKKGTITAGTLYIVGIGKKG